MKVYKYVYLLVFAAFLSSCLDYKEKAESQFASGAFESALKNFDKALELSPYDHYSFFNRGRCKQELGKHEEAIRDFDRAIDIKDLNPQYFISRGQSYFEMENYKAADLDFKNAIQRDPDNYFPMMLRGKALLKLDESRQAYHILEEALKKNTDDPNLRYYSGMAKAAVGNSFGAIADFTYYLKNQKDDPIIYFNRGQCYMSAAILQASPESRLPLLKKASLDFEKAIKLRKDYEIAQYKLAMCFHHMGEKYKACQMLRNIKNQEIKVSEKTLKLVCL